MKRIVNGVTYNTDTSTALARAEYETDDGLEVGILYQTRGGAFFLHLETQKEVWNQREQEKEQRVVHTFEPLSPEASHKWMLEGEVEVFNNPFEDPPEAAAEAEPGATIYIRVPASLKKRVDEAAKGDGLSGNTWAMRCVEQCLASGEKAAPRIRDYEPLDCIIAISSAHMTGHDWDEQKLNDALGAIYEYSLRLCEELGINKETALLDLAEGNTGLEHAIASSRFRPYADHRAKE